MDSLPFFVVLSRISHMAKPQFEALGLMFERLEHFLVFYDRLSRVRYHRS